MVTRSADMFRQIFARPSQRGLRDAGYALPLPLPLPANAGLERRLALVATLSRNAYGRAYEPGCGDGEITSILARRCHTVVATHERRDQIARVRRRCAHFDNVVVSRADPSQGPPPGRYDLMILNDTGFLYSPMVLSELAGRLAAYLQPGGELIAVHGLGSNEGHRLDGDAVHCLLGANLPLDWTGGARHVGFRIDRWERGGRPR
jgi:hypothetical protein